MQKLRLAGTERGRKGNELHYCDTLAHMHKRTQNRQHIARDVCWICLYKNNAS